MVITDKFDSADDTHEVVLMEIDGMLTDDSEFLQLNSNEYLYNYCLSDIYAFFV
jgi:hypothetical protein